MAYAGFGGGWFPDVAPAPGTITGGGTPGRIPVFTGATTIGDSYLNQVGSNVQLDAGRFITADDGLGALFFIAGGNAGLVHDVTALTQNTITTTAAGISITPAIDGTTVDVVVGNTSPTEFHVSNALQRYSFVQGVLTSGTSTGFLYTAGAHTGLTAGSEVIDWNINLSRTVQRATGAVATQRAVLFQAPTYSFVGASTITSAATLAVSGAPVAGTNATITNRDAAWIQAGTLRMADAIRWTTGTAVVATQYSIQRDNVATNNLALNVPTGAGWIFSENGTSIMTMTATSAIISNNGTGTSGYFQCSTTYSELSCYAANSRVYFQAGDSNVGSIDIDHSLKYMVFQGMKSTGTTATMFSFIGAADTTLTASTERLAVHFNLAQTVQHATGALTTQRAILVSAPTYSFVGASTISDAATVAISGAPIAGTNATITRPYAFWVQAGGVRMADSVFTGPDAVAAIASELLLTRQDQNAVTRAILCNATSGTAARAQYVITNSSTAATGLSLSSLSAGFTTSNINVADAAIVSSSTGAGLNIGTTSNTQMSGWTNNTERYRVLNTGEALFGYSALASTEVFGVQKNQNASTISAITNTTSGTAGRAFLAVSNSATIATGMFIQSISAAFTSVNIVEANTGIVSTNNTAGLNVGTTSNTQMSFWTNNTKRMSIAAGGDISFTNKTIDTTAGDSATINATIGRFRKDTSGTTFTLTNNLITANSIIILEFASDPGITGFDMFVVAGAGSAVITFTTSGVAAAPTNNTDVNFYVFN